MASTGDGSSEEHEYVTWLVRGMFPKDRRKRRRSRTPGRTTEPGDGLVIAETEAERRATAVATLLLAQVRERRGSVEDLDALLAMASRALDTFPESSRAGIIEETVAVLDWLADHLIRPGKGPARDAADWGDVHYDAEPHLERLQQAIDAGEDLAIEYFSFHRGEWSTRRVSPQRIDGAFLVGWCHMRDAERRFRVTRIRSISEP